MIICPSVGKCQVLRECSNACTSSRLLTARIIAQYLMTGDSDYMIRVAVADIGALEKFILNQLKPIPSIEKIRSSFALKQVRYKTALPLPCV